MSSRQERGINPDRTPEFAPPLFTHPIWWHHHGFKMEVVPPEFSGEFKIKGSAAEVTISADPSHQRWNVDWKVIHTKHTYAQGRTEWSDEEFQGAFGEIDSSHYFGDLMLDRFGGDSAERGGYIRYENFLSIPGPGTGHDFDTNVSIFLTDDMRGQAMRFMEENAGHPLTREPQVPSNITDLITSRT